MLTFRALLDAEPDPRRRRALLASKVEDMLNTVVRQIAFYRFETLLHDERKKGEVAHERIGELWMQVQIESLGPAFDFTPDYSVYWAYIPHFVHTPFYVYAYAFGDCLVNALYGVFREGHPGFQQKYLDMLKAGRAGPIGRALLALTFVVALGCFLFFAPAATPAFLIMTVMAAAGALAGFARRA